MYYHISKDVYKSNLWYFRYKNISIDKWNQEYDKNLISKCHAVGYLGFNDLKNCILGKSNLHAVRS